MPTLWPRDLMRGHDTESSRKAETCEQDWSQIDQLQSSTMLWIESRSTVSVGVHQSSPRPKNTPTLDIPPSPRPQLSTRSLLHRVCIWPSVHLSIPMTVCKPPNVGLEGSRLTSVVASLSSGSSRPQRLMPSLSTDRANRSVKQRCHPKVSTEIVPLRRKWPCLS